MHARVDIHVGCSYIARVAPVIEELPRDNAAHVQWKVLLDYNRLLQAERRLGTLKDQAALVAT